MPRPLGTRARARPCASAFWALGFLVVGHPVAGASPEDPLPFLRVPATILRGDESEAMVTLPESLRGRARELLARISGHQVQDTEADWRDLLGAVIGEQGPAGPASRAIQRLLSHLRAFGGDIPGATSLAADLVSTARQAHGEWSAPTADAYRASARCQLLLGRPESARGKAERALEIESRIAGPSSLGYARSQLVLASTQTTGGDLRAAQEGSLRAMAILGRELGEDAPEVALALPIVARILAATGRLDEALLSLDRSEMLIAGGARLDPGLVVVPQLERFAILLRANRNREALEAAGDLLQPGSVGDPGVEPRFLDAVAGVAYQAGDLLLAERLLRRAREAPGRRGAPATEPAIRRGRWTLGALLLERGEHGAARIELEAAQGPDRPGSREFEELAFAVCVDLARSDFLAGGLATGIQAMRDCLLTRPRSTSKEPMPVPGRLAAPAHLHLASMLLLIGDLEGAHRELSTTRSLFRRHPTAEDRTIELALDRSTQQIHWAIEGPLVMEGMVPALEELELAGSGSSYLDEGWHLLFQARLERGAIRDAARIHGRLLRSAARHGPGSLASIRLRIGEAQTAALAGRPALAAKGAREALDSLCRLVGTSNPFALPDRSRIAEVFLSIDRPSEAGAALANWGDLANGYRPEAPVLVQASAIKARLALVGGRTEEAIRDLGTQLDISQRAFGTDAWTTSRIRATLAIALAAGDNALSARQESRRALAVLARDLDPSHPELDVLQSLLGRVSTRSATSPTRAPRSGP